MIVPQTPYSSSSLHSGVGPDGGASLEYLQWPFEAWGATAVFSGDEHNYERLMRDDNADATELPYIVTGNGGRVLNGFDTPAVTGSQVRLQQFGAVIATADGSGITFEERTVGGGSLGTLSDTVTVDAVQVPPWTAYIDTNGAGTGTDANALSLTPPNGTTCSAPCDPFPSTDTFTLKDFSDGSALTGIQMQVDANVDVVSNNPTTDPFMFGDQGTVFGGKVSGSGVYSSTSTAGHKFDLNFTGLDDTKTYTVVVGSDRFDTNTPNVNRWSQFQLTGAASLLLPRPPSPRPTSSATPAPRSRSTPATTRRATWPAGRASSRSTARSRS